MRLDQVRAVITGGVSGLGLAVARHLVQHGGKVVLFDINDEKGDTAVASLGSAHALYLRTDVTNETEVASHIAHAREFLGSITAAINCAGVLGPGRVLGKDGAMPLSTFQTT